ncbi:hypothetical protein SKAU_G00035890 [Synaphobranchus kaupii]|uniref:Uncharacterized protein n=1 Tax=Synaphobranchus kaupii TaxID=118154 RepID=A0A9Q1JDM5_SYNKA|nr:hypothetical protein SKAU_G00035890 [Synaphobranchus kaupii]
MPGHPMVGCDGSINTWIIPLVSEVLSAAQFAHIAPAKPCLPRLNSPLNPPRRPLVKLRGKDASDVISQPRAGSPTPVLTDECERSKTLTGSASVNGNNNRGMQTAVFLFVPAPAKSLPSPHHEKKLFYKPILFPSSIHGRSDG